MAFVKAKVAVKDYRSIIQQLTEAHPARKYWTNDHRKALSHEMLQAIDGIPQGDTLDVDQEQWVGLATDLVHVSAISPPQWAAEIARCVVFD